jgi:hypothetical protein
MKALKLQSGDGAKPSKAISSNRAAAPLPIGQINRAGHRHAQRLLRGKSHTKAPARRITAPSQVFRQADFAVPKPHNIAPACGSAGRGPPILMMAMGMLALLIISAAPTATAQPGVLSVITDGIVADYPFHGYLYLPGGAPAVDEPVWVVNQARTDSLEVTTNSDGRYENDPLTSVPDAYTSTSLLAVPNPDPRTIVFSSPNKTGRAEMKLYDVRGREVTDEIQIPAGAYIARVLTPEGTSKTTKVVFSQSTTPQKLSLEQRLNNPTQKKEENKAPSSSLSVNVKVNKQGYEPVNQEATLQPTTTTIDPITLQTNGVEYRLFGESWNQRARDKVSGTLILQTHSDGTTHYAPIDTNNTNHFDITLTGYEPTETITLWVDNDDYTNNGTSVFPKGIVASTNNITRKLHEAPTTTLEALATPEQGLFVYSLADSVYNNPSFRQGLQDQNLGIIKDYPHTEMTYYIFTTNADTGQPISQREIDEATYIANYLHEQNTPRNEHTMLSSNIITSSTLPSNPIKHLFLFRGHYSGQGNGQYPANQPYFDYADAMVNTWDDTGYLFREAIEAMRVGDDASGNNGYAVSVNGEGEFIFSTTGQNMYVSAFLFPGENPNPPQ